MLQRQAQHTAVAISATTGSGRNRDFDPTETHQAVLSPERLIFRLGVASIYHNVGCEMKMTDGKGQNVVRTILGQVRLPGGRLHDASLLVAS